MDSNKMASRLLLFFRINIRNNEKKLDNRTSNDSKKASWYSVPNAASLAATIFEAINRVASNGIRIELETCFFAHPTKSCRQPA